MNFVTVESAKSWRDVGCLSLRSSLTVGCYLCSDVPSIGKIRRKSKEKHPTPFTLSPQPAAFANDSGQGSPPTLSQGYPDIATPAAHAPLRIPALACFGPISAPPSPCAGRTASNAPSSATRATRTNRVAGSPARPPLRSKNRRRPGWVVQSAVSRAPPHAAVSIPGGVARRFHGLARTHRLTSLWLFGKMTKRRTTRK
jgi:hypothetical protein